MRDEYPDRRRGRPPGSRLPELTVRELATRERVTPRTVYHWIEKGAVTVRKTPGGALRILDDPAE